MVPVENWVEHSFAPYLNVSRLLSKLVNHFGVQIFNFICFPVQVELHILILDFAMVHLH